MNRKVLFFKASSLVEVIVSMLLLSILFVFSYGMFNNISKYSRLTHSVNNYSETVFLLDSLCATRHFQVGDCFLKSTYNGDELYSNISFEHDMIKVRVYVLTRNGHRLYDSFRLVSPLNVLLK